MPTIADLLWLPVSLRVTYQIVMLAIQNANDALDGVHRQHAAAPRIHLLDQ